MQYTIELDDNTFTVHAEDYPLVQRLINDRNILRLETIGQRTLLKESLVALRAAKAEIVDLREELCGEQERGIRQANVVLDRLVVEPLIEQAERAADAIAASEDEEGDDANRLAYLEEMELVRSVALYREQRERWHDDADNNGGADDEDTEIFDEDAN